MIAQKILSNAKVETFSKEVLARDDHDERALTIPKPLLEPIHEESSAHSLQYLCGALPPETMTAPFRTDESQIKRKQSNNLNLRSLLPSRPP